MGIKENLKMLRKAKNLKQTEVGKMINKKPLTIGRYENGTIAPSFAVLEELAKIYDVSVNDILTDVEYVMDRKYTIEEIKYKFEKMKKIENMGKELLNVGNIENVAENPLTKSEKNELARKERIAEKFDQMIWGMFADYWNKFLSDMATKRGTMFWEVFTEMGDIFINGKYDLSPEKKDKILNDMKQYLDFLISKEKK